MVLIEFYIFVGFISGWLVWEKDVSLLCDVELFAQFPRTMSSYYEKL